ncbi:uncharacterized protein LOC114785781 isoform X3 [Denticeps clupeoides]|uniref:uncharacterized protein LOC114785781 isoform X3 n=1 Tax=Denticeps clupeoides TaxID=299321 RepID=UPI0010A4A5F0|nr:uncharacterized protein LOC114785781 isoform X3 [Denticeps clupeoides]XP_028828202.1 uncharacterized protein LOC114785781 isoform X3 [Denticeps clupeoides]
MKGSLSQSPAATRVRPASIMGNTSACLERGLVASTLQATRVAMETILLVPLIVGTAVLGFVLLALYRYKVSKTRGHISSASRNLEKCGEVSSGQCEYDEIKDTSCPPHEETGDSTLSPDQATTKATDDVTYSTVTFQESSGCSSGVGTEDVSCEYSVVGHQQR